MVSSSFNTNENGFRDSYRLIDISGSETENEIVTFVPLESSVIQNPPKKKRLKRKERDLLRSSGSYNVNGPKLQKCCGFCCSIETKYQYCRTLATLHSDGWEFFRSALLILTVIGLTILEWQALSLQHHLKSVDSILSNVEASGSELPAKFHESHVRLQQLEKNHTSLWETLTTINNNLENLTQKFKKLEGSITVLQETFSGSPQLSSLPKDVTNIQDSVAAFGSSLQDVQSAVKAVKEEQTLVQSKLQSSLESLTSVKKDVHGLYNTTKLVNGRESSEPINDAVLQLRSQIVQLNSSVSNFKEEFKDKIGKVESNKYKVQNMEQSLNASIWSLQDKVQTIEETCTKTNFGPQVNNLTSELLILKESSDRHYRLLQNLTQSLAVVKGVEKKLKGTEFQMATKFGELQKLLQETQNQLNLLTPSPSNYDSKNPNKNHVKSREIHLSHPTYKDNRRIRRMIP